MNVAMPQLVALRTTPDGVCLHLRVPADLRHFAGHFPGLPIVPGVVQLGWAIALSREHLFDTWRDVERVEVLKFHNVIRPQQEIDIDLAATDLVTRTRFRIYSGEDTHASGRLLWAAA